MSSITDRSLSAIDLELFKSMRTPEYCSYQELETPEKEQHLLRLLVEEPYSGLKVPEEFQWTLPIIKEAKRNQKRIGVKHPFVYLTIRHGIVKSEGDDVWHTDGFSMRFTHVPEQNYIWVDHTPTEFATKRIDIPSDFNPNFHNLHLFLQDILSDDDVASTANEGAIYAIDPYVVHRRPKSTFGKQRTFVRVSFTPIEIVDKNNAFNPEIPRHYTRDGVTEFRDRLFRYLVI
jgi:hypothetical protein